MTETAILAGGCFWCLEAVFQKIDGVQAVTSGYMGGQISHPSYEQVCSGNTGHAEVVKIDFDPQRISYADLLDIFFTIHDPTTLNRQGNDIGSQYRSAIFYGDESQRLAAHAKRQEIAADFANPIVTEIVPVSAFWPAETYHQNYFAQHAAQPYCAVVITPKVSKAREIFAAYWKMDSR